ncbi:MAG: hypothetical protein RR358_06010 [Cetobacterium sp.]
MQEKQLQMQELINRKNEIEFGILPFVEPSSAAEDLAFGEYFNLNKEIGRLIRKESN